MFTEILKIIFGKLRQSYRDLISALAITLLTLYILKGMSSEKQLKEECDRREQICEDKLALKDEELKEVRRQLMEAFFGQHSTEQKAKQNDSIFRKQIQELP